tara:strand:+ start:496 stop:1104 length:609 start_codon:yes stop_codon:yes gene_type:complete
MLELLADAMEMPDEKRSALLGRFQHLQRLKLVEGVNPGRGRAAEYNALQVLVFSVAFQMLQLGMTPERCVDVLRQHQDLLRLAISLAVQEPGTISPALLWFDPSILNRSAKAGEYDLAEATFNYGGAGTGREVFEIFFVEGMVQRMAFISVSGTLWHLVSAIEGGARTRGRPPIGEVSAMLLDDLSDWFEGSKSGEDFLGGS